MILQACFRLIQSNKPQTPVADTGFMRGKNIILRAGLNLGPASANRIRLVPDNAHYVKISGSPHNALLLSLETCPAPTPVYHFLMRRRRASRIFTVSPITSRPPDNVDRSSTLGSWGCRSASRRCTGGFAKLVAGNVENGKAPTLLWKRLEIRLDKNLNRLVAGINLNTNRRIAKVHLVASSVHSSNDGVGHYRLAPESLAQNSVE